MMESQHQNEEAMLLESWVKDPELKPRAMAEDDFRCHRRASASDLHRFQLFRLVAFFIVAGVLLIGGNNFASVRRARLVAATATHSISLDDGETSAFPIAQSEHGEHDDDCHTVQLDDQWGKCFHNTKWAKTDGIYAHPEWYKGLNKSSLFEEFQAVVHKENFTLCPKPCPPGDTPVDLGIPKPVEVSHHAHWHHDHWHKAKKNCTKIGMPVCYPPEEVGDDCECHSPRGPKKMTFYMYRAQNKHDYDVENLNTADLAGVLWYLHREVVASIPRKFFITRIIRYKVTMKNTQDLYDKYPKQFGPFVAYDSGSALGREDIWKEFGYVVGCQTVDPHLYNYRPNEDVSPACFPSDSPVCNSGTWYSLPGPCPDGKYKTKFFGSDNEKNKSCIKDYPGGRCSSAEVTGTHNCTYWPEYAGEISLDELEGIDDYDSWWVGHNKAGGVIPNGNMEYNYTSDRGVNMSFWDKAHDKDRCTGRMDAVTQLFKVKYPDQPATLPQPWCS